MKRPSYNKSFGKRLANLRKAKGFSQTDLANAIGVSTRVLAYYECETEYPPSHLLIPIAKTLKLSIDELMGLKTSSFPTPKNIVFWKKLLKAEKLDTKDRKALLHYLDALIQKNNYSKS